MAEPLRNLETLQDDGEFLAFRTTLDGVAMIAVRPSARNATAAATQLANAFTLREQLATSWALIPRAYEDHYGTPTLLVDDPGGELVSKRLSRRPDLSEWLRVAIGAASSLRELHARGIVHRNLKPSNLFITTTGEIRITGFGLASRVPREGGLRPLLGSAIGTLAYMPPEQTGRLDRPNDARSDLYSLGITLYELAAGTLPFAATDASEWIHAHLARTPAPLDNVPSAVGAIIAKLLSKTPDERYQTATGLEADLRRCRLDWERHGLIDRFPLGENDPSERLLIRAKLYGRDQILELMRTSFERVARLGAPELVMLSGYAGIGKSSVANELKKLVATRALFAIGKSEQYRRDVPYGTLAQALQQLVRQTLGKSEAAVERTRIALVAALGPNGQLAVDLVPELELLLGKQPALVELAPADARSRFRAVLGRLVGVFARREQPLVVFLDDLQWADPATVELLADLMTSPELRDVFLVGAIRDDEVPATHPLRRAIDAIRASGALVQEVSLPPLGVDELSDLVADAMQCTRDRARTLADIVHAKTGGNPFFAIQFLRALVDELLVVFDRATGSWVWDVDRVRNKGVTDNVVDLLARRLDRFRPIAQQILQSLACLGREASVDVLCWLHGVGSDDLDAMLWEVTTAGLVVRRDDHYAFIHDRVQEAAYALILESDRPTLHAAIGRALLANFSSTALDARIFDVVDQFLVALPTLSDPVEVLRVAELMSTAGRRAHAASAFTSALKYLSAARELLGPDWLTAHYSLAFATELSMAECEFLTAGPAAEERLAWLAECAKDLVDLSAVTHLRVTLAATTDLKRANDIGLGFLRRVGIEWSQTPTETEVTAEHARMWELIGDRRIEDLVHLPLMTDAIQRAVMNVLLSTLAHAVFTSRTLHDIIVLRMINISLVHGNCDASCLAYAEATMVLGASFKNYVDGYRFTRTGFDLVERAGLDQFKQRVYLLLAYHVVPWNGDVRDSLSLLRRALEASRQAGDFTFSSYSWSHIITSRLARGDALADVQREAEAGLGFVHTARFGLLCDCFAGQLSLIASLRGSELDWSQFPYGGEAEIEQHFSTNPDRAIAGCWYWTRKLQARLFADDIPGALAARIEAAALMWTTSSHFERAEYTFFAALAHAADNDRTTAQGFRDELAAWEANAPETFANRVALIDAELARIDGRMLEAERHYERAIVNAEGRDFCHHEALASERAARFYAERDLSTIAHSHLRRARDCYARWGAAGCVTRLENRDPIAFARAPGVLEHERTLSRQIDIDTVVKMSQVVSSEIVLDKLLSRLMHLAVEHAGAGRGLMVLAGDPPRIVAEAMSTTGEVTVHVGNEPITPVQLPESILNYVVRTLDAVVLDDVAQPSAFSDDEYLRKSGPRSVLCLPLVKTGALVGVLYLENQFTTHVFTSGRRSILELLASQAAISLDNAHLFAESRKAAIYLEEAQRLSNTGSFGWNSKTGHQVWSAEMYKIFGIDPSVKASSELGQERIHPDDRERVARRVERVTREASDWESKHRIVLRDGSIKHVHVVARTVEGDRDIDYIGAVMDVTEAKMADELRRAKESAETANRAKDLFMANVSHELRTPLNAILGMTELVLDGPLADEQRTSLATVKSAADGLAVILDELLDFAKIEAGKLVLDLVEVSLQHLARDVLRPFAVRAERKDVELVCDMGSDVPEHVFADPVRLHQVLTNLVGNAVKFTNAGHIVLEIRVLGRDSTTATLGFAVRDTGVGIPPDKQAVIFEAFEQADPSTTRRHGGTGLGLTIASRIVELMAGSLVVASEVDHGSTFSFEGRFPLTTLPPRMQRSFGGERALVVDDQEITRLTAARWLEAFGLEVTTAATGAAALAALDDDTYAVAIIDAIMPPPDGLALVQAIRDRGEAAPRIVLMAPVDRPGTVARFRELGGDAHVHKPVLPEALFAAMHDVLGPKTYTAIEPAHTPVPSRRLRILVAEDHELNLVLMRTLLATRSHDVRFATTGVEAIALAAEATFDVVLLDVHLPEADGFQVIESIRRRERTTNERLAVIAMTARSRKEDREACLAAGMDAFLPKPIRAADLWAALDRIEQRLPSTPASLVDARVLLASCGGDMLTLERIATVLQSALPRSLTALQSAATAKDSLRVREAAHKLYGLVAPFSTLLGTMASTLEERAIAGDLTANTTVVEQIVRLAPELTREVSTLTVDALRSQLR